MSEDHPPSNASAPVHADDLPNENAEAAETSSSSNSSGSEASVTSSHSDEGNLFGPNSPGVVRVQAIAEALTTGDRVRIFLSIFLLAYVYGLDGLLRYVYQPYATAGFATHSTLATINVLRAVIAAAVYPAAAKIADVFGRLELVVVSVVLYLLGTVVEATCQNVQGFAAGAVIYQIGYTTILLLVEVIVADITSLKTRLIFSYIPTLPFLINTWISGNVSNAVLGVTTWRWGIGMWGIILAFASIPLMISLWIPYRRARRNGGLNDYQSPLDLQGRDLFVRLFWQLDVVGIFFVIAIFSLILVPLTIAGGSAEQWGEAKILGLLITGFVCIPLWVFWERNKATHPIMPIQLLKDRAVWGALGIACMLNFCWYLQGNFLYTVLIVAFDESILSATRITSLFSFCSVLTGAILGFIVLKVRYLKPFIVAGTFLFLAAFGTLIHFRGGDGPRNHSGIIGAQIMLGIAGGLFPFPAQASIQASTRHEHVAVVTGLYLATYNIGSAFGNAVSGAIWTQTLVPALLRNLPPPYDNKTVAEAIFGSPFDFATNHPIGTPLRDGIVESYKDIQKLLTITGICLCIPLIAFSLCIRNPRLGSQQSLPDAEVYEMQENDVRRNKWLCGWK